MRMFLSRFCKKNFFPNAHTKRLQTEKRSLEIGENMNVKSVKHFLLATNALITLKNEINSMRKIIMMTERNMIVSIVTRTR